MPVLKINSRLLTAAAAALLLAACNPAFNWRDVRPEGTSLGLLMPCKPDMAVKKVPLGGQAASLQLLGCDAGDLTFAVASAEVADAAQVPAVLAAWQQSTLVNMKAAKADNVSSLTLKGATGLPAIWVKATGVRTDGTPVAGQAVYFAQGAMVFQAVIYGRQIKPDVADTYFSGMKFD